MVSDDTEHTVFVAQSLLTHPDSPDLFVRRLSWSLRWWLLSLPAGIGFATLRAILRLWMGFDPSRSGVYSAGNGPAMRSAPIGAFFAYAGDQMDTYLEAATRLTHTDPKALIGAKAIAHLTAWVYREQMQERPPLEELLQELRLLGEKDEEWQRNIQFFAEASTEGLSVEEFACSLGLSKGVTGYVYHTVPVVVYAWYRHFGSFDATLEAVLNCGGDTDTTGAIAGALAGAVAGASGIPSRWINDILEWPRGVSFLTALADRLAAQSQETSRAEPVRYFWPGQIVRNMFFLAVVLAHGFRRLAPPY